jgi:hypothetical protein
MSTLITVFWLVIVWFTGVNFVLQYCYGFMSNLLCFGSNRAAGNVYRRQAGYD